jgi:hypothetical protein
MQGGRHLERNARPYILRGHRVGQTIPDLKRAAIAFPDMPTIAAELGLRRGGATVTPI